jgi:hypothetical protein
MARSSLVRLTMIAVLGISCARSTRCDEATGACGTPAASVALGADVVLTPGRIVEVAGSPIRLVFDSTAADSRCASDVQCVWAGNAAARVRVWADRGAAMSVELNTMLEPKQAAVNGYLLRLVALSPNPVSTSRIEQKDYRLTVRVDKTN